MQKWRSAIRRLFFTLLVGALTAEARAGLIEYNMTGTVTSTSSTWWAPPGHKAPPPPVATGDHIAWTLQYDPSTPASSSGPGESSYSPAGPVITNLVDQTNGIGGFTDGYYPPWSQSALSLSSTPSSSSLHAELSTHGVDTGSSAELDLVFNGPLPTSPLANVQLGSVPLNLSTSFLTYDASVNIEGYSFTASVNSISAPIIHAPEPESVTLFLLGTFGLTVHGRPWRRWKWTRQGRRNTSSPDSAANRRPGGGPGT